MSAIKLAVIGAGARVERFYAPILAALKDTFDVVGLTSRNPDRARARAAAAGWRHAASVDELLEQAPEAALLALPPEPREELAPRLLARGLHLFVESPAALRPRGAHALAAAAARAGRVVEVAEEQAFAPAAELHRRIVAERVLGRPLAVVNDGLEYYHHAYARLHRLLGELPPAAWCGGRNLRLADGALIEQRELAMSNGIHYLHRFASPKSHPSRSGGDWRVVCERGALTDRDVVHDGLTAQVTVDGRRHAWTAPCGDAGWTGQHHGLAALLTGFAAAVRGAAPLHGIARAARDLELTAALELAARAPLPLPGALACALARWR